MACCLPKGDSNSVWRGMGWFGSRLVRGRWFMVFASQLIMATSGANYLFSLYPNDLKLSMGYDQATLNLVSFFKDLGCNVGIIAGLINEVTPPWVILSIGATINFIGYFMVWLAVTGHLKGVRVWQMCVYICIGANSLSFSNTGTLVTCVKNFPESRGIVIGLFTGFVGLSGAIFAQFYHALYGRDSKSLILLISWLPGVFSILFLRTIRVMKLVKHQNEKRIFNKLLYISLSLAGFLMVMIILQNRLSFTRAEYYGSALGVIFFLFLPLVVAIKEEYNISVLSTTNNRNEYPNDEVSTVVVNGDTTAKQVETEVLDGDPKAQPSWSSNVFNPPDRGEDYTILQALFSIDMQLLFVSTICGLGGTLTAIDNMGQIGTSLGYPTKTITTFVSLTSIWNYLGRALSGLASELVLSKYKFPRPMVMTLLLLFSCIGHLLIAFGVPNTLYVASVIIGFCFGAQCPLVHAIISEIFGLKHYSTLQHFGAMAVPIGTYVFNVTLTGKLYDRVGLEQLRAKGLARISGEHLSCVGVECYKLTFLIIAGVTFFGCLISFILVLRTRKFYKGDIYKKFKEVKVPNVLDREMGVSVLPPSANAR